MSCTLEKRVQNTTPVPEFLTCLQFEQEILEDSEYETVPAFPSSGQKGLSSYLVDSITSSQKKRPNYAIKNRLRSTDESNISDSD